MMHDTHDVHSWSKLYREERLDQARTIRLEGLARAERRARYGHSRVGRVWGGVMSLLQIAALSD